MQPLNSIGSVYTDTAIASLLIVIRCNRPAPYCSLGRFLTLPPLRRLNPRAHHAVRPLPDVGLAFAIDHRDILARCHHHALSLPVDSGGDDGRVGGGGRGWCSRNDRAGGGDGAGGRERAPRSRRDRGALGAGASLAVV